MAAATQSAEVEVPRERFPRASLTGFFLGFSPAAASCVAAAAVIAGFAAPMIGGLHGVGVSLIKHSGPPGSYANPYGVFCL